MRRESRDLIVITVVAFVVLAILIPAVATAQMVLVPMDLTQTNHLKAYGHAYRALEKGYNVQWLLNYRGGSFLMPAAEELILDARLKDVSFETISGSELAVISAEIEQSNMEIVLLEKAPKIAVYIPPVAQPWDDAVTLAMVYAEIPYEELFDEEVLVGKLSQFDWLHLHHEDFTGQYGKFYGAYRNAEWYQKQQRDFEERAQKLG
ncbi:MAG: hypothetical protein KAI25_05885, partial [Hyphomicrobiaceae bacterium]|nr:hypothetical protein [Hyphomicrobiaceae bacterium]